MKEPKAIETGTQKAAALDGLLERQTLRDELIQEIKSLTEEEVAEVLRRAEEEGIICRDDGKSDLEHSSLPTR